MKTILTLDKANQPFGFPQLNSGGTFDNVIATNITGTTISAATYLNLPSLSGYYLPLSGGTVTGDTIFQSGLTANTISAATYLNLPGFVTTGITGSSEVLTTSFNYYGVSFSGNVDLILPNAAGYDGKTIVVKDESGLAGIYRIRLSGATGLIDNTNYVDMNTNYISLTLMARNNNWWII